MASRKEKLLLNLQGKRFVDTSEDAYRFMRVKLLPSDEAAAALRMLQMQREQLTEGV